VKVQGEKSLVFKSGKRQNLRAVSTNPHDGTALIVGNAGTIILLDEDGNPSKINVSTAENLRATSWSSDGSVALIARNRGTLLKYTDLGVETVNGGTANLRRTAWRPDRPQALVTSNCFAEEFIPSPNLFVFDPRRNSLSPVNEGRADLIGVDWSPDGESALVVGYDVIWHNGHIGSFDGRTVSPIEFEHKRVYPVGVSWNPSGQLTAIVTATAQPGMGQGSVYVWDGKALKPIFNTSEFFFSSVAWNDRSTEMAALASSATRTYNC
jgi:WD40 repeat protein